jgi:hypothetical protein
MTRHGRCEKIKKRGTNRGKGKVTGVCDLLLVADHATKYWFLELYAHDKSLRYLPQKYGCAEVIESKYCIFESRALL